MSELGKLLIPLLVFAACNQNPEVISKHGVWLNFTGEPWPPAEINKQEDMVLDKLLEAGKIKPAQINMLSNFYVDVVDAQTICRSCSSPEIPRDGVQFQNWAKVKNFGSVKSSPYMHEMLHFLKRPNYDPLHEDTEAWGIVDYL